MNKPTHFLIMPKTNKINKKKTKIIFFFINHRRYGAIFFHSTKDSKER